MGSLMVLIVEVERIKAVLSEPNYMDKVRFVGVEQDGKRACQVHGLPQRQARELERSSEEDGERASRAPGPPRWQR